MTQTTTFELDQVFGEDSKGDAPEERAQSSRRLFVRSQHQISVARSESTGRRYSASEMLREYGWNRLRELVDHTAVPVVMKGSDPVTQLKEALRHLGVEPRTAFGKAKWSQDSIAAFEKSQQVPFGDLERLSQFLSLDAHALGQKSDIDAAELGVRLRSLGDGQTHFSTAMVLALAEAGWVVRKQLQLAELLGKARAVFDHQPSDDYGSLNSPAWRKGHQLAAETREKLALGWDRPIESMTGLLEELGIPVIHVELPKDFAGATISSGSIRGIVINTLGKNNNVWVRRMTMAHELGHFLWDPPARLQKLVVDSYSALERDFTKTKDKVEQRANAFAVELLAPEAMISSIYRDAANPTQGIIEIMQHFGVGRAAATYHVQNTIGEPVRADRINEEPDGALVAREEFVVSYPALDALPISRRGRFVELVVEAVSRNLLSEDTAAAYLSCPKDQLRPVLDFVSNLDTPV